MKNKTLTIITEGGKVFGFGHITRCLSIANQFKKYNYEVNFIIDGDNSLNNILQNEKFIMFNWKNNQDRLLDILSSSLILIDSIEISDAQIKNIENKNMPIVFIDDESRRNILDSGFIVDWTVLGEKKNYFNPKKDNVIYLLGSKFTPMREEFTNALLNPIRNNIQNILISFGGSDIRNLTPKVLENLNQHYPNVIKNIIIGDGFTNIKEIEKFQIQNVNLIFNATSKQIVSLMQTADIAISAGGQTLYELARIGTPTIAILLVKNAIDDTIGWEEVGSLINIGWWDDPMLVNNLVMAIKKLQDINLRKSMQQKSKDFINPNGAKNLVDNILKEIL
jgi:spore coat polysaccharide biosynthesis predicted glycosyltransferase SpsG